MVSPHPLLGGSALIRPIASRALIVCILLLAALLRFQNLDAIEHNVDHAYPIWQALMTLDQGVFPVTAQGTSVLFANPPLTGYLFLPAVAITRLPFGPYIFAITLNTMAVFLAYRAACLLLGNPRALLAAFLMAINPWAIEYSRTTWVQSLIPFFICLVFWLLVPVLSGRARNRTRRLIWAMIALTAMTQTYLLAFAVLAPVAALFIIFRRHLSIRALLIGCAIFIAAAGIYGAGLLANREETINRVQAFVEGQPQLSGEALSHAIRLVTGRDYPAARGVDAPAHDSAFRQSLTELAHVVILAFLVIGIVGALFRLFRPDMAGIADGISMRVTGVTLLIWFGLPILMMSYVSRQIHPFYLLLTLPAGYLLAAWGAGYVLRWRAGIVGFAVICVPLAILFSINTTRFAEETRATPGKDGLGALPVGEGVRLMESVLSDRIGSTDGQTRHVVFADVDEWTLNSLAGRLFQVDRDVDLQKTIYLPADGAIYLQFERQSNPQLAAIVAMLRLQQRAVVFADGASVQTFTVDQQVLAGLPWVRPQTMPGDAGIGYMGVSPVTIRPGTTATILTAWRIDVLAADRAQFLFAPYAHIFDATGKRVAIGDGAVTPGWAWRLGDVQIKTIDAIVPDDAVGPFKVVVGQYDGVHSRNVTFTLPDGSLSPTIPVE